MILRIRSKFSSAHRLPEYKGDCGDLHGHTWRAIFEIEGPVGPQGMVCDFKELKPLLAAVLPDHKYLNDFVTNPTAENICAWLFEKTSAALAPKNLKLITLEIWENEDAAAIIRR
ncbi:MAG: 6-carboxytetrahydropterin synthase [Elusimicrobiota bacterium]|jgi:6-pyruvoyltetrahydropterin/6-carboxytetrahydropterin synthase|nr:6-carboxytetrahydropterin synthase [Elusimicrobiota bacterium]